MANAVTLSFAGDAKSLSRTFDQIGDDAKKMAGKVDDQSGKVRKSFDRMGEGADASEGKFMGVADVLDGLGGAFGLPTEQATGMMRAFGDLSGGFATLQPVMATFSGFMKTQLGSAMTFISSHPLLVVVGLLAVAFVTLYTQCKPFRDIINEIGKVIGGAVVDAFNKLKEIAVGVFNWVSDNWPLLLAILTGPIGLAVLAITKHWDTIKAAFTAVKDWVGARIGDIVGFITGIPGRIAGVASTMWDGLKTAFTAVKDWVAGRLDDIVGFFTGMGERIGRGAARMWDGLKDAFRGVINTIIGWWNGLDFKLPKVHVPGTSFDVGGFTLGTPDIPKLHAGGVVPGPLGTDVLALLQAGERVIPRGGGGATVQLVLNGPVIGSDPAAIARWLQGLMLEEERRSGQVWVRA